ncbi:hypothetical protein JO965_10170 [Microvirga sp. VF16]|nr:hypothetical protein [Microvirga sp. VF16]QRM32151.1 hypothetical protein JO965_10170 [Microvirga sp. VF16]
MREAWADSAGVDVDGCARKSFHDPSRLFAVLECHNHQHIDAGLQISLAAPKHLVDTSANGHPGVRAGDDDHIRIKTITLGYGRAAAA